MVYGIVGGVFADHLNIEIQMAYVALYNIFKKEIQQGGQTRFLNWTKLHILRRLFGQQITLNVSRLYF